ncbi:hypothetical protein IT414_01185 [bacterium]|nr:hypothetical protein [bacterium]
MQEISHSTVWFPDGKDKYFEHYRLSSSVTSVDLRRWVDEAYFDKGLSAYLDKGFVNKLRNEDFYGRLWELELAEWLMLVGLKMIPTNGSGPDFCIELTNGSKVWIEATLSRPDVELEQIWKDAMASNGKLYNTPRDETGLRYATSLVAKAEKISSKYSDLISPDDYVLIAVSAFPPGAMRSDIDMFMRAVLPIDNPVVYFSLDDISLDEKANHPTHTVGAEFTKKSGVKVKKEFLYPGQHFSFIDGVIFSEASNLQELLGVGSGRFDDTTNRPHVFANYAGKELPREFTDNFYFHKFVDKEALVGLEMQEPIADLL